MPRTYMYGQKPARQEDVSDRGRDAGDFSGELPDDFEDLDDIDVPDPEEVWMRDAWEDYYSRLFGLAAEGDAYAQDLLQGDGHGQDILRQCTFGVYRYRENVAELAADGDANAQYRLGLRYYYLVRNYEKAADWFELAAEQGHTGARAALHDCRRRLRLIRRRAAGESGEEETSSGES